MSEKPMRRMATCDAERELCHHAEQLRALQDWVQEVRRAAEGPENAPIEPNAVQYSAGKQPIHRKDMP